jgi:hypothetical protein
LALLARVGDGDKIRLAGIHAHNLERRDVRQPDLFEGWQAASKARRLNQALDLLAQRFGAEAVTRGLTRVERAAPSRRVK